MKKKVLCYIDYPTHSHTIIHFNPPMANFKYLKSGDILHITSDDFSHSITLRINVDSILKFKEEDPMCFQNFYDAISTNPILRKALLGKNGDRILAQLKIMGVKND